VGDRSEGVGNSARARIDPRPRIPEVVQVLMLTIAKDMGVVVSTSGGNTRKNYRNRTNQFCVLSVWSREGEGARTGIYLRICLVMVDGKAHKS